MDVSGTDRRVTDGPPSVGHLVALAAPGYEAPGDTSRERRAAFGPAGSGQLEENFPPIANYALLSDCENTCLVAPTGAVEWLCLPAPDDPSIFGTLLDRSAGSFRFAPSEVAVPVNRRYVPAMMVLATTWQTRTGWLAVRDFLAVGPWHRTSDRSMLHRRTPSDFDARHVLVRMATCLDGAVEVELNCEPSFDYGRVDATWEYAGPSYESVLTTNADFPQLTLSGDLRLGIVGRAVKARHQLSEGESCFVDLSWGDRPPPATADEVRTSRVQTDQFWREWLDRGRFPDHPWREHLQRSALTLKALTYLPTGALLAAPTTSLPEHVGGQRNWDYRYTWVRDSSFTMWALQALGLDAEAEDFLAFLGDLLDPDTGRDAASAQRSLQVLYGVDGRSAVPESHLDHLSGYAGSRPIRVGNAAYEQDQLDILGAIVDCVYQHTRTRDSLSERSWSVVVTAVEITLDRWRQPDRSIWEMRGAKRHYTYSKVCAGSRSIGVPDSPLFGARRTSLSDGGCRARDPCGCVRTGCRRQRPIHPVIRVRRTRRSLLLLPLLRFLPPDDDRIRSTVLAIADELTESGFVLRYRTGSTDDGLSEPEASFTVCSFWLVSALVEIGETARAHGLCERLLVAGSALGLYGEEIDTNTGRHLGNFPQALTHLALVNAVLHVIDTESYRGDTPLATVASPNWWVAAT
jgi:GH15 family glucan-1,4-alpha-glucosidase